MFGDIHCLFLLPHRFVINQSKLAKHKIIIQLNIQQSFLSDDENGEVDFHFECLYGKPFVYSKPNTYL